tara:strand:- start:52 stop:627 length:576 start_codon:yes stop_codon:yes gene_type:complete
MLGSDQSGHIASVGFDLYCKLIEDMIRGIRGEKVETKIETEVNLLIKGHIPNDYVPDLNQRLELYRRIQMISNRKECIDLSKEIIDRFGPCPESVEKLMTLIEVRILCQLLHVSKAKIINRQLILMVLPTTSLNEYILSSVLNEKFKIISEFEIGIPLDRKEWRSDCKLILNLLQKLSNKIISKKVLKESN